jgi:pimeloyl-ACP methyl ester carboxylesterase
MKKFQGGGGATLSYETAGDGPCVLAIHGAYSTHHELASALEPLLAPKVSHRRIYPDIPGMGMSPPHNSIQSSNDVVDLLEQFIDDQIGRSPFAVIGHSYGAHLARGLAARRPRQVTGLFLICPLIPGATNPEPHAVVRSDIDAAALLDPSLLEEYLGYFVVQTDETVHRFNDSVVPTIGQFDDAAVERIMSEWALHPDPDQTPFEAPTLILTGRHDSWVGYRDQANLVDRYPRATYVVLADTGHALLHERPDLFVALLDDWLMSSTPTMNDEASDSS